MTTVNIPRSWVETSGSHSLEGLLFESGVTGPGPVTLRFETDPVTGKGPGLILAPDFVPGCLAQSIVYLCEQGYELKVEIVEVSGP